MLISPTNVLFVSKLDQGDIFINDARIEGKKKSVGA
jgi:hypothetical protein